MKNISCSLYEQLELFAMRKTELTFTLKLGAEESVVTGVLVDFKVVDKMEYGVLESGERILLTSIVAIDKIADLGKYNFC